MLVWIPVLIAVLGASLLGFLMFRIREAQQHLRLTRHRQRQAGMTDLLNYASVIDDGVILNKNGSLMAAWIYEGPDGMGSTDAAREKLTVRLNQALMGIAEQGWMIHVDAIRRDTPSYSAPGASHFPDRVTRAIDMERREQFSRLGAVYDGAFVITVTYYPPILAQAKFQELMFDDDADSLTGSGRVKVILNTFTRACDNLEANLASSFRLARLKGQRVQLESGAVIIQDDFLRFLQFCVTGLNHPVNLPQDPSYLDNLIGGQEFYTGVTPKIGTKFVQCVAIDGFPMESYPGILDALGELPIEYRWSSRFIFMDRHSALALFERYRKKWRQKIRGFMDQFLNKQSGAVDEDAARMVGDAQAAMADINEGLVAMGYYTSVVILMSESRAQVEAEAVTVSKAINDLGFNARVETINTVDAFIGSFPGHGVENVRRPLIHTLNLADFIPTSTIWTGSLTAPCPMYPENAPALMQCVTHGSSPFRLNLHVRDLGHSIILGPTRSGKSTLLGMIAAQARRYPDASVFVFDKGGSMMPICKAAGGSYYDIGSDGANLAFAPLQYLETHDDRAWAVDWIETILELNRLAISPAQRNEIRKAVENMHESGARTLTELASSIQDQEIRDALEQYTIAGSMGYLLDADEDALTLSNFTTFEIETLMGLGERYTLPVLLYLFRRIERRLNGQPAILIIDEAWLMLAHSVFREKIREWLKAFAKKNCAVVMATQNLSDASESGIMDVIVESTATKVFLPNPNAREENATALYIGMGLNTRQIEIVASSIPKRQYYFVSEEGSRLFELALGPLALSFVGATDQDSLHTINALERKHGDGWIDVWLADRGLALENYEGMAA